MSDGRVVLGVDLDGVLANFIKGFLVTARKVTGRDIDINHQQQSWDFENDGILTKAEVDATWHALKDTYNWWEHLEAMPGTKALRSFLPLSDEFRFYFITSRVPSEGWPVEEQSGVWLEDTFAISVPTVITEKNKGPVCHALKVDYFLDDKLENCLEVEQQSPQTRVYVKDAPYNRVAIGPRRVATFDDFIAAVRKDMDERFN